MSELGDAIRRARGKPLRDALQRSSKRMPTPDPEGLRWRGPWTPTTRYEPGDAVESEGSSYVAIRSNVDERPPSPSWQLLARRGEKGFAGIGADGQPGAAGPPGPAGPPGTNTVDVEDEGVGLGSFTTLDFVGAGVTASDAGGGTALITIPGGGGSGVDVEDEGVPQGAAVTLDFVGAGVMASVAAGVATITIPGGGGSADEPTVSDWFFS